MRAVARLIPQPLLGLVSGMCAGVEFTMRIIKSSWAVLLRARNELLLAKLLNFGGLDITACVISLIHTGGKELTITKAT